MPDMHGQLPNESFSDIHSLGTQDAEVQTGRRQEDDASDRALREFS